MSCSAQYIISSSNPANLRQERNDHWMIKISLKQLCRTPIKSLLFMVMISLTICCMSIGIFLWDSSTVMMKKYNDSFITIGTVEQKETMTETSVNWDAATKSETYYDEPIYDEILPASILNFYDEYLLTPKQRPYYGAFLSGSELKYEQQYFMKQQINIVEIEPYEDCVPSQPGKMRITQVLWGNMVENSDIYFCDHYNRYPEKMLAGAHYITMINHPIYNSHKESNQDIREESIPTYLAYSSQVDKYGNELTGSFTPAQNYAVVGNDFSNTQEGKQWREIIVALELFTKTFPVVPTDGTEVLMDFYSGEKHISLGRDISREEYEQGANVCLISSRFAKTQGLEVGDKIDLEMYYADYKNSSSQVFAPDGSMVGITFGFLNSAGEAYNTFQKGQYSVVGIYSGSSRQSNYELGYNAVVVPDKSIKYSDENNIVSFGPMKNYTTSFRIENGAINEYLEEFNELEIKNLEINFYDQGFSSLEAGMERLKTSAVILLIIGIVTTICIFVFFEYIFILKQKKRTAIERSLGMSKTKCAGSLLIGVLLITIIGSLCGTITGQVLSNQLIKSDSISVENLDFDTTYSHWVEPSDLSKAADIEIETNPGVLILIFIASNVLSVSLALLFIGRNIKVEPLKMLSLRGD